MRRFRKILIFIGAAAAALGLTVRYRGNDLQLAANAPLNAAVRPTSSTAAYDLAVLPVFTRTLFFVNNSYFDKNRFDHKRMLVGALDFLQRDVPEILIDRQPERDPQRVIVKVGGQQKSFDIQKIDAVWNLKPALAEILRFVQANMPPLPAKDEPKRLLEIEMAATNGMLYTLDPHSILLDIESFKDMRAQTQGKFGGLGIVIGLDRKGRIMVRKPMPETPAMRAGIKAKDRIVRINNESTVNMTLVEAVERLRGDVGAPVDVYIDRDGASGVRKYNITRDFIRPPAIDPAPRVLSAAAGPGQPEAKIGYFHINSFSANTDGDLTKALQLFEQQKVKGIIMDLRGNPGGLYDQAQRVADAFIEQGVLVSMVGVGGAQRKDERATRSGDTKVPLAVLVNQSSASASEIVAGAVKNLDRGVIIGETTFGKGSVQMLFDIESPVQLSGNGGKGGGEKDTLGLKLTTAQYLTPGDVSIQGIGVTPDIELVPMQVTKRQDEVAIRLQRSTHRRQESDYEWHLENPNARKGAKPTEVISYLVVPPPGQKEPPAIEDDELSEGDEAPEPEEDTEIEENRTDFLMEVARDMLAQTKSTRRREMLSQSKAFFEKVQADEDKKLSAALEKLGVDWTAAPANPPAGQVQLTLGLGAQGQGQSQGHDGRVQAGNTFKIRGTAKNVGPTPVYRVRAVLQSDNPRVDENEMVFGKINPGETKSYDLTVKLPKSTWTRTDVVSANLYAAGQIKANTADLSLNIEGKARPLFAYSYQTVDDQGNRDGQVQRGEKVRLLVKVKNIGSGPAIKTEAILRNGPGQPGILISAGRFDAKDLPAGATKNISFVYEVGPEFQGDEYQLELAVADTVLGESVTDKIKIKVAPTPTVVSAATGTVTIAKGDMPLRESPVDGALVIGKAPKGATYKVTGKAGAYTRVEVEEGRPAFVPTADVAVGGVAKAPGGYQPVWQVSPPLVAVTAPTTVTGPMVRIKGLVTDDIQVKDVYVRVFNRESKMPPKKVFYQPNRGDKARLPFEADLPLWPGSNIVQVFARETNEVQSVTTVVVLQRDAPSLVQKTGSPAATPEPKKRATR